MTRHRHRQQTGQHQDTGAVESINTVKLIHWMGGMSLE